ncbi:MAG: nickel pincer cofactor biosynthesis protein LarC [Gemmatimonadetes bacterium]|nr:nickel pincer cofactor biosynthesis protein LarC [Gemmatimonadota bacterium]
MRVAHFDPVTGAAGDMILAALIDAGAPLEEIRAGLATLPVPAFRLETEEIRTRGFRARRLVLEIPDEKSHRHLPQIREILGGGSLPPAVVRRANDVFDRLAEAEARSHGIPMEKVHFHEVGALDAILDIAGACLALHLLDVSRVTFSALRLGTGEVNSAHGRIPVPVPAVLELTRGLPVIRTQIEAELLTPTGAAILTTLGVPAGSAESLAAEAVGVGAGYRELPDRPNVLRVSVGVASRRNDDEGIPWESDEAILLEANVDDLSPELLPDVLAEALREGALDAWITPVLMKKGRPGHVVSVLAEPSAESALAALLLRETTTFGVRRRPVSRWKLARRAGEVETPHGTVRVKIGNLGDRSRVTPEYESCRAIAERTGLPLLQVYREVEHCIRLSEWKESHD